MEHTGLGVRASQNSSFLSRPPLTMILVDLRNPTDLTGAECAPICGGMELGVESCWPRFHIRTALSAPPVKIVLPSDENVEQSAGEPFSWLAFCVCECVCIFVGGFVVLCSNLFIMLYILYICML